MLHLLMLYLSGQVQMSEDDFVKLGEQVPYDDLITAFEPVTGDLQNMVNGINNIANQAPQYVRPIMSDVSYLQTLLTMHKGIYTQLLQDNEPSYAKEAYLRALYQLPPRLFKVIAYMEKLMATLQGGDDD